MLFKPQSYAKVPPLSPSDIKLKPFFNVANKRPSYTAIYEFDKCQVPSLTRLVPYTARAYAVTIKHPMIDTNDEIEEVVKGVSQCKEEFTLYMRIVRSEPRVVVPVSIVKHPPNV
jgi:hypothetical protein